MRSSTILVGILALAACGDFASGPEPSAALRALGIETLEHTETDRGLLISGIGADGTTLTEVDVRLGMFIPSLDGGPEVDGRTMRVRVLEDETFHESIGNAPVMLPLARRNANLRAALVDPHVSSALARWGVAFDSTEPVSVSEIVTAETSYYWSTYVSSPYPMIGGWYSGCGGASGDAVYFDVDASNVGEYRLCFDAKISAERRCDPGHQQGVEVACGLTGSFGCAVCWTDPYQGDANVGSYYEFAMMMTENW
jgi:hypothetical protein